MKNNEDIKKIRAFLEHLGFDGWFDDKKGKWIFMISGKANYPDGLKIQANKHTGEFFLTFDIEDIFRKDVYKFLPGVQTLELLAIFNPKLRGFRAEVIVELK